MTANHPDDLVARQMPPVLMSAGGMPYNGEWIDYWEKRALAAESTIRNRDETIAAQAAALNWAMDEIDVLSNKLRRIAYPHGMVLLGRSDQRDNYRKALDARRAAIRALASPHQEGTGT